MALERASGREEKGHTVTAFTESEVESAALAWLEAIGWSIAHGLDISPGGETLILPLSQRDRESYREVVLAQRLRDALAPNRGDAPSKTTDEPCLRIGMRNGCA